HVVLLQDILGYQSLSAGFWVVAIDYQLGLLYVLMLYLQDALSREKPNGDGPRAPWLTLAMGGALAAASLFFFNTDESLDPWAIFFFGHFFMGVVVCHALEGSRSAHVLALYA